jgi:hypothetical protein
VFFLLQGLRQKPDNTLFLLEENSGNAHIFGAVQRRRFHLLLKFLYFVDNKSYNEAICSSKRLHKLDHLNAKVRSVYTPECDVSVVEPLMMWKGHLSWKVYIPSKHVRFGIKSFELCEAKYGYVRNFTIYTVQDTVFDEFVKNEPYGSRVVLQLMAPLLNQGYCFEEQFSSFIHTSLELAKEIQFQPTQK